MCPSPSKPWVYTHVPSPSPIHMVCPSLCPFWMWNSPLATVRKLAFIIHIIFTYLLNHRTRKADSESLTTSIMKNELVTRIKYVFTVKCVISLRYIVKIMCSRAIWFSIHPLFNVVLLFTWNPVRFICLCLPSVWVGFSLFIILYLYL